MKSGKNFIGEIVVAFACYYICCLNNPHEYFTEITGIPQAYTKDKNFDIVNVSSVDESQARQVFFDTVKNVLRLTKDPKTGENWFERYVGLNLKEGGFGGNLKSKIIEFPTKESGRGTIRLMSFNSTASAPEGIHCLLFIADELSRADTKLKYQQADKLLNLGLNNTTASFQNRVGKVIEWSYLNDTDFDLTNDRYELSFTLPQIYGAKYATWEVNPNVTKETFADRYKADPVKAKQVFEGIKPKSRDAFFQPYVGKIQEAVSSVENRIRFNRTIVTRYVKDKTFQFTAIEIIQLLGDMKVRCFSADPSKVRDRFVITGGYMETRDPLKMDIFLEGTQEVISTNKKPVIDIVIIIEPTPDRPIDYVGIGEIFTALIKAFPNTKSINSDHFQNEKLRQEIITQGVQSETYFFSNQKQMRLYTILRANVWNNNIEICTDSHNFITIKNQPASFTDLWSFEAEHLIKEGQTIDHPNYGSKDLTDSIAITNYDLMMLEALGDTTEAQSEDKFRRLTTIYMEEKYKLIQEEIYTEIQIDVILKEKLSLREGEYSRLKDFVKENYNY